MKPRLKFTSSQSHALLSAAALLLLTAAPVKAANLYWDGSGTPNVTYGITAFNGATNWSTSSSATTPDPGAVPGASDLAIFNISTLNTPVLVGLNGNRTVAGLQFSSTGATTIYSHPASNTSYTFTIGSSGMLVDSGAGAVTTVSNSTTGFISYKLAANQSWTNNSSNVMTLGGGITASANATPYTLTLDGSGSGGATLTGVITNNGTLGTVGVTVNSSGGGTYTLSGNNNYSGLTTLTAGTLILSGGNATSNITGGVSMSGGTLKIGSAYGIGSGALTISGGTLDTNGATARTLSTTNAQTWSGDFAFTGSADLNLGTGAVTLSGGSRSVTVNGSNLTVGGAIGDGGNAYGLTKAGTGTLILSGSQTYTGATTISAGTLKGAIGSGALSVSGTYDLNGADRSVAAISGAGGITLGANTLTTSSSSDSTFSGALGGTGGLTKSGSGILTLSGTNTYTGATSVTAGGLKMNGTLASSAVTIANTATLSGTGTFSSGTVTVNGTHSPGNSPGLQTFNNLTYGSGAAINWELAGNTTSSPGSNFDKIVATGTLDFGTAATFNPIFNGAGSAVSWSDTFWSSNQQWLVYTSATLSNFNGLSLSGTNWQDSGGQWLLDVHSNASFNLTAVGNDVYLNYSAVPEPSTYAALAGVAAFGLVAWRRRQEKRKDSVA